VRPLVAVVVGVVLVGVAGDVHSLVGLVQRLGALALRPFVLLPVAVCPLVLLAGRVVATRRSLASRTRLVVLAPDTFDPPLDGVLRCAAQLSRVRRVVGGWLDPRASAVRVLLDSDSEGRTRYSLVVPERSLAAVRAALSVYERVEARTVEPVQETPAAVPAQETKAEREEKKGKGREMGVVRAELRLARASSEPLAQLALDPDPLQSFAQVLAGLDHRRGERAQIAVDLLPSTAATRRRLRRRLLKEAQRHGEQPGAQGLLDVLRGPRTGRQPAAEMVSQRAAREEIAAKLLQSEPLFGLQVLRIS
jgi:hypothetical protein